MPSLKHLLVSAVAFAALSGLGSAQTNITEKSCASSSDFSKCNRDVASKWSSCVRDCNSNGNCIVDCGCESHRKYINCMAESCWNQVRNHTCPFLMNCPCAKLAPRSTRASISCSFSSTLLFAQVPTSQFPSGQRQTMPRIAAPAT